MHYNILRLAKGGFGISCETGKTFFVEGALPGESGESEIIEEKERYGRCRAVTRDHASPFRADSDTCPCSKQCGGCGFRHVIHEKSLELKADAVHQNIIRQAHLSSEIPVNYWPVKQFDESRRRVRIHVSRSAVGFYAPGSHKIVDISKCMMLPAALKRAVQDVALSFKWKCAPILDFQIDLDDQNGAFVEVTVPNIEDNSQNKPDRNNKFNKQSQFKNKKTFMGRFEVSSVESYLADAVERGIFMGAMFDNHVWGESSLRDIVTVDGQNVVTWRRIGRFGQATREANEHLHKIVAQTLNQYQPNTVYDLFCGAGNFTFRAAMSAKSVTGVEFFGDRNTFAAGLADTSLAAKLGEVKFRLADLDKGLPNDMTHADLVIADPARVGMTAELCHQLVTLSPAAILYISCEPSCLARDLGILTKAYEPVAFHYVDMFPCTPDVEAVVLLVRK